MIEHRVIWQRDNNRSRSKIFHHRDAAERLFERLMREMDDPRESFRPKLGRFVENDRVMWVRQEWRRVPAWRTARAGGVEVEAGDPDYEEPVRMCARCGADITAMRSDAVYCSHACRHRMWKVRRDNGRRNG